MEETSLTAHDVLLRKVREIIEQWKASEKEIEAMVGQYAIRERILRKGVLLESTNAMSAFVLRHVLDALLSMEFPSREIETEVLVELYQIDDHPLEVMQSDRPQIRFELYEAYHALERRRFLRETKNPEPPSSQERDDEVPLLPAPQVLLRKIQWTIEQWVNEPSMLDNIVTHGSPRDQRRRKAVLRDVDDGAFETLFLHLSCVLEDIKLPPDAALTVVKELLLMDRWIVETVCRPGHPAREFLMDAIRFFSSIREPQVS